MTDLTNTTKRMKRVSTGLVAEMPDNRAGQSRLRQVQTVRAGKCAGLAAALLLVAGFAIAEPKAPPETIKGADKSSGSTSGTLNLTKLEAKAEKQEKSPPPIFSNLTMQAAIEKSRAEKKVLVVKFTAEWCGPCKKMDATTWREARVEAWAKDNAIVIAVDVDKDQATSQSYGIKAMPTMLVIKDGIEFDRNVGFMNASEALAWMTDAAAGKRAIDGVLTKIKAGEKLSVDEKMDAVDKLIASRQYEEAGPIAIDLWQTMAIEKPAMFAVRLSFFVQTLSKVCASHAPTREKVVAIRDAAEESLRAKPDWALLTDWMSLNEALEEQAKTLEWFDRNKLSDNGRKTVRRFESRLYPLLEARGDLRDLAIVANKPLSKLQRDHASAKRMLVMLESQLTPEEAMYMSLGRFREQVGRLHAGLILDERANEAETYRVEAIKRDDTPEMRVAIVEIASQHLVVTPEVRVWAIPLLDQADTALATNLNQPVVDRSSIARQTLGGQ